MTVPGHSSIKGFSESPKKPEDQKNLIKGIVPNEEFELPVPQLNPSARNDLEIASQRAIAAKATRYHENNSTTKVVEYRRIRGEIGEEIAAINVPGSIQADSFSTAGTNFSTYDLFGEREVSQVKVLSLKNGKPRYQAYKDVFQDLVDPNSKKNNKAAEQLFQIKENDPKAWEQLSIHLPSNVRNAKNQKSMQEALADQAVLRIPQDQVDAVRSNLQNRITKHPEKFGLDPHANSNDQSARIEEMVNTKILSIDERYATAHYQAKAAELVSSRDLITEKQFKLENENTVNASLDSDNEKQDYDRYQGYSY